MTATVSAPVILNKPLATAGGLAGQSFSYSVAASGSPLPTFSISSGILPGGLSLNPATGLISGTPAAASGVNVTITATSTAGSDSAILTFAITPALDPVLMGAVSGSAPWAGDMSHAAEAVFDGSISTFFAPDGANTFARIDLGASLPGKVTALRYYPRDGFEARMLGGKFQGSGDGIA